MTAKVPSDTCVGHIHLKVTNLEQSIAFYRDVLGFTLTQRYGDQAAFLSAGRLSSPYRSEHVALTRSRSSARACRRALSRCLPLPRSRVLGCRFRPCSGSWHTAGRGR